VGMQHVGRNEQEVNSNGSTVISNQEQIREEQTFPDVSALGGLITSLQQAHGTCFDGEIGVRFRQCPDRPWGLRGCSPAVKGLRREANQMQG
jgi:hypothetical protein